MTISDSHSSMSKFYFLFRNFCGMFFCVLRTTGRGETGHKYNYYKRQVSQSSQIESKSIYLKFSVVFCLMFLLFSLTHSCSFKKYIRKWKKEEKKSHKITFAHAISAPWTNFHLKIACTFLLLLRWFRVSSQFSRPLSCRNVWFPYLIFVWNEQQRAHQIFFSHFAPSEVWRLKSHFLAQNVQA